MESYAVANLGVMSEACYPCAGPEPGCVDASPGRGENRTSSFSACGQSSAFRVLLRAADAEALVVHHLLAGSASLI